MKPSKRLNKRLDSLRGRREYLKNRILNLDSKIYPGYDLAELGAIDFAISFIEENRELALQKIARDTVVNNDLSL